MKQRLIKTTSCGIASMMLIMQPAATALAETITIGKGTGILWEGLPFNTSLSGPLNDSKLVPAYGLLAISIYETQCMGSSQLKNIGGYMAYPISGASGVGLIPRVTGSVTYTRYNNSQETLTGTIGLPETKGSSPAQNPVTSPSGYAWCLPPQMSGADYFYSGGARTATLSGTWVLVADSTQKTGQSTIPPMYSGSYSNNGSGDKSSIILPSSISLRVSMLECSVSTPTTINFGSVNRSTQAGAELALMPVQLVATCGQTSDRIDANINLQFRAISGLYNNVPSQLALNQGGGYITGEIDGGVTGSGDCGATTGLNFDNTAIKLGSITSAESSKTLVHQITWRLCSGGSSLPIGAVTASTEMLVTFN
jgi:hypothetical protein